MKHPNRIALVAASCVSVALALGSAGCGGPTQMVPAKIAPFSAGTVDASYSSDGNGNVTVKVKHLGDPSKLDKNATTYVVWLTPEGAAAAQNEGAFKVDSDGEGKREFPATFKKFKLVITAESAPDVATASGNVVLTADYASK